VRAVQVTPRADTAEQFVMTPHHPDRLRRPASAVWSAVETRRQQALLWNVFRTFELLPPAFWLRRLHARLFNGPCTPAPQVVRVKLWEWLPLPPAHLIDGARPNVAVDVLIETDRAVWSLIAPDDRFWGEESGRVAAIIDAGAWFARSREHYCGVVETPTVTAGVGSILQQR
jgi:hypothetical protein